VAHRTADRLLVAQQRSRGLVIGKQSEVELLPIISVTSGHRNTKSLKSFGNEGRRRSVTEACGGPRPARVAPIQFDCREVCRNPPKLVRIAEVTHR
jgi:hypothetical protein